MWIWWDDAHVYNMHLRKILKKYPLARAHYELSAAQDPLKVRGTVRHGRDLHNLRVLSQGMSPDEKLALAKDLINEAADDLEPLRALERAHPERFRLCNLRSHEFLTGMHFLNMDAYDQELTLRGMFAASASDILRYEVLYNYGGVYMDVDIDLLSALGRLEVDASGALVGITPDRKFAASAAAWPGRELIATTPAYTDKSLYLSNCIVAAAPRSPLIDAMRQTIRLAYRLIGWRSPRETFELDPDHLLEGYWKNNTTRSTLDLTGPNMVRDLLWLCSRNVPWEEMPSACLSRLCATLVPSKASAKKKAPAPSSSSSSSSSSGASASVSPPFDRVAPVWRDDVPEHVPFWQWVAANATFPMVHVECVTEAAGVSDCDAANLQVVSVKAPKAPESEPFHFVHFPSIPRGGALKGLLNDLHTNHKIDTPLPLDIKAGDEIVWGAVRWKVTELGKQKGLVVGKKPITLIRL
ncbi:TcdA/TcdB catalytic glycosyltransferase domain-containing protein [Myxococcus eversor]|uniref:TcdA/TcdB catalytic glycosyltransferase domain-containing protein n=1 Tax=Myxococcus eversor TaxID=2709661 RepID=UPI0013D3546C|nr:TcdA/TcdB catalytic glycosyltransferase domain-containing protein [Myxococcus eversor]